jgi:succinyl-CoA synthetase beta subunit
MLLVEADGKALFQHAGIQVPAGVVVGRGESPALSGAGPWMVKAQVPVGGRGKAGGVMRCGDAEAVHAALARQLGLRLKGHAVQACLVEQAAAGMERYLALVIDPAGYGVRALFSAAGGVDIEQAGDVPEYVTDLAINVLITDSLFPITDALLDLACHFPGLAGQAQRQVFDSLGLGVDRGGAGKLLVLLKVHAACLRSWFLMWLMIA